MSEQSRSGRRGGRRHRLRRRGRVRRERAKRLADAGGQRRELVDGVDRGDSLVHDIGIARSLPSGQRSVQVGNILRCGLKIRDGLLDRAVVRRDDVGKGRGGRNASVDDGEVAGNVTGGVLNVRNDNFGARCHLTQEVSGEFFGLLEDSADLGPVGGKGALDLLENVGCGGVGVGHGFGPLMEKIFRLRRCAGRGFYCLLRARSGLDLGLGWIDGKSGESAISLRIDHDLFDPGHRLDGCDLTALAEENGHPTREDRHEKGIGGYDDLGPSRANQDVELRCSRADDAKGTDDES